eukprot:13729736-Alexandrium_andersonii.AAC.1
MQNVQIVLWTWGVGRLAQPESLEAGLGVSECPGPPAVNARLRGRRQKPEATRDRASTPPTLLDASKPW